MYKYPVYQPALTGNEKKYVNECLDSTWISSKGQFVQQFENEFANYTESKHALSCSNGTVALHLALVALGIGKGDEVIVPTLTYIAAVNAISYTGATPVFADSETDYWQIDPNSFNERITSKTKAIIIVHLYGHPCNMDEIFKISKKNKIAIIEDCAEAFGALYNGKHVGQFGDIATYSFFGNKTITTGEGGMVTTNNDLLAFKVNKYKGQGLSEGLEYWHDEIGYNYRMTNIACAIGLAQLEKADEILAKKREIAKWYKEKLEDTPVIFHQEAQNVTHSYWMCSILLEKAEDRDLLREHLKRNGIETRPLFYPVHQMPIYNTGKTFINAEKLAYRGVTLPSYPGLEEIDIEFICNVIKKYYNG